jgi:hypothetical protein
MLVYFTLVLPILLFLLIGELITKQSLGMFDAKCAQALHDVRMERLAAIFANRALRRAKFEADDEFTPDACHVAHLVLGKIACRSGQLDEACSQLLASASWWPFFRFDDSLARALRKRGREIEVVEWYARMAELSPDEDWKQKTKHWVTESRELATLNEMDYKPIKRSIDRDRGASQAED